MRGARKADLRGLDNLAARSEPFQRWHLGTFLAGGGRKIDRWYGTLKVVEVSFDDEEAAFRNINTRDELVEAAKDLPRTNHG